MGPIGTGAVSFEQQRSVNCRLWQMTDQQLRSVAGFRPHRGPLSDRTIYVSLTRPVAAGEELLLNYGADYWRRHPVQGAKLQVGLEAAAQSLDLPESVAAAQ